MSESEKWRTEADLVLTFKAAKAGKAGAAPRLFENVIETIRKGDELQGWSKKLVLDVLQWAIDNDQTLQFFNAEAAQKRLARSDRKLREVYAAVVNEKQLHGQALSDDKAFANVAEKESMSIASVKRYYYEYKNQIADPLAELLLELVDERGGVRAIIFDAVLFGGEHVAGVIRQFDLSEDDPLVRFSKQTRQMVAEIASAIGVPESELDDEAKKLIVEVLTKRATHSYEKMAANLIKAVHEKLQDT